MFKTLISATDLHTLLSEGPAPCIFDCRARLGEPTWGAAVFTEGHLPGAQHLDLDQHLAAPAGSGGRHPLPDSAALTATLRNLGLQQDQQVVLYDDAGGAFAGRAWWCLRWLGHAPVAVLDGGLGAFAEHSRAGLEPGAAKARDRPGNFQARAPLTRLATVGAVQQASAALTAASAAASALLDARAPGRFAGREEPIDAVAGHIPGARCQPFSNNLNADGHFKTTAQLQQQFGALPDQVICYCGSGVTAAHNILALVHAGYPEPALYAGSWSHWITDPERPVAREA